MTLKGKVAILKGIENENPRYDNQGAFVPSDWDILAGWHEEEDIIRNITDDVGRFRSVDELKLFLAENYRYPIGRLFMVKALPAGKKSEKDTVPVGYVAANTFDYKNRKCSLVVLIAEKDDKGKFGCDALKTMCGYLNQELGIHRVEMVVPQSDDYTVNIARDAGFKQEGILKDYLFYGGKYHNSVILCWMGA